MDKKVGARWGWKVLLSEEFGLLEADHTEILRRGLEGKEMEAGNRRLQLHQGKGCLNWVQAGGPGE